MIDSLGPGVVIALLLAVLNASSSLPLSPGHVAAQGHPRRRSRAGGGRRECWQRQRALRGYLLVGDTMATSAQSMQSSAEHFGIWLAEQCFAWALIAASVCRVSRTLWLALSSLASGGTQMWKHRGIGPNQSFEPLGLACGGEDAAFLEFASQGEVRLLCTPEPPSLPLGVAQDNLAQEELSRLGRALKSRRKALSGCACGPPLVTPAPSCRHYAFPASTPPPPRRPRKKVVELAMWRLARK